MNRIPVVVISDNKLAFAIGALFVNLLDTKKETTFYELVAVVSPDTSKKNIDKIKQIQNMYPNDCSIKIIQMDNRFDAIPNKTGYIANACAYKMCLAEMLPNYDKIIYLDTDIIVFDDLSSLYNTNMDDYYIAGVHSIAHYIKRRELAEKCHIPDLAYYVNAGVMVMNLQKIRKDNIQTKLTNLIGTYNDSVDQHIFNRVCYGNIKLLPPVYNVTQSSEDVYNSLYAFVGLKSHEIQNIKNFPVIYHYTGPQKPWEYYDLKYSLLWLRNYKKSPFGDTMLTLSSYYEKQKEQQCYLVPNKQCRKRMTWYKWLFSMDKRIIESKRTRVLRLFGFEIYKI